MCAISDWKKNRIGRDMTIGKTSVSYYPTAFLYNYFPFICSWSSSFLLTFNHFLWQISMNYFMTNEFSIEIQNNFTLSVSFFFITKLNFENFVKFGFVGN